MKETTMGKKKRLVEDILVNAAIKFLEKRGWAILVISVDRIEQRIPKYNFSLVINFTGKKKEQLDQPKKARGDDNI